jgi:hypothetical protein
MSPHGPSRHSGKMGNLVVIGHSRHDPTCCRLNSVADDLKATLVARLWRNAARGRTPTTVCSCVNGSLAAPGKESGVREAKGLFIVESECPQFLRTVPVPPRDPR